MDLMDKERFLNARKVISNGQYLTNPLPGHISPALMPY